MIYSITSEKYFYTLLLHLIPRFYFDKQNYHVSLISIAICRTYENDDISKIEWVAMRIYYLDRD